MGRRRAHAVRHYELWVDLGFERRFLWGRNARLKEEERTPCGTRRFGANLVLNDDFGGEGSLIKIQLGGEKSLWIVEKIVECA